MQKRGGHRRRTPPPSRMRIGRRIRDLRLRAGLSQTDLAEPFYTRAYISAIELDKVKPSLKSLEHIARKLHTDVGDLTPQRSGDTMTAVRAISRALDALDTTTISAGDRDRYALEFARGGLSALLAELRGTPVRTGLPPGRRPRPVRSDR